MATSLLEFDLDRTGLSPDNLIVDELHAELDQLTGILIPDLGDFFTESLIVKDVFDTELVRGTDYIPIEFNQTSSLKYGKEIHSAILIIQNKELFPFSITYQVLGGDRTYSNENLLTVTAEKILPPQNIDYEDLFEVPLEFKSKHHLHDIDEVYGFERIVEALTRVEKAILAGAYPAFKTILAFIDSALFKIGVDMRRILDDRMENELVKFKAKFTKEYFGIENIPNLSTANEREGYTAGKVNTDYSDIAENKLMTIDALVGLKRIFFESFVRKQMTGIDMTVAVYGPPTAITIRDLTNRSTVTVISKLIASENNEPYDDSVYPDELPIENELIIMKLNNGFINGGGDILGFDQIRCELYHGEVYQDWDTVQVRWKNNFTYKALQEVRKTIEDHMVDDTNPHKVTKQQIGLGKVENLPIVEKEELDNITSVRKYMTFESLMYFMRVHLLQNGPKSVVPYDSENKFLIDNAVVVYSPGGGCSADPEPYVTGLNTIVPTNATIGWSVNGGKPNTKFTMTTGLIGRVPEIKTYTLNAVGSYVGFISTGDYAGTIQSLFDFEGGKTIITNTIVEKDECPVDEPVVIPTLERTFMVKLGDECAHNGADPDPYALSTSDNTGFYGYTEVPPFTPEFNQLVERKSVYCESEYHQFNLSSEVGGDVEYNDIIQINVENGEPNGLIEGKIYYDRYYQAFYFNQTLDQFGSGVINLHTGTVRQNITLSVVGVNKMFYEDEITFYASTDSENEDDVIQTYVRVTDTNPEANGALTAYVTHVGLRVGTTYEISYTDYLHTDHEYDFGPDAPKLHTATRSYLSYNFIIGVNHYFVDEDMQLRIQVHGT